MTTAAIERRAGVTNAIAFASRRTGVDFTYLLGQAQVESGLNADARATTSSARGLYQFIDQSWLGVVKAHGAEHGLGWAADSIARGRDGRFHVADAGARQAILSLRGDPATASLMAAEHASDNKDMLEASLGRAATGTDLYMAHFLGIGGAKRFLRAMDADSGTSAAALFPGAARANRGVFYAADGSARSLGAVYQRFAAKLDKGAAAAGGTLPDAAPLPDVEVVMGSEAQDGDRSWLTATLGQARAPRTGELMRPNPQNARLAYLMLAQLGGM